MNAPNSCAPSTVCGVVKLAVPFSNRESSFIDCRFLRPTGETTSSIGIFSPVYPVAWQSDGMGKKDCD